MTGRMHGVRVPHCNVYANDKFADDGGKCEISVHRGSVHAPLSRQPDQFRCAGMRRRSAAHEFAPGSAVGRTTPAQMPLQGKAERTIGALFSPILVLAQQVLLPVETGHRRLDEAWRRIRCAKMQTNDGVRFFSLVSREMEEDDFHIVSNGIKGNCLGLFDAFRICHKDGGCG